MVSKRALPAKNKIIKKSICAEPIVCMSMLSGCLAKAPVCQQARSGEVQMYGGINRMTIPELTVADASLIADISAQLASRENAAAIWGNLGFKFP